MARVERHTEIGRRIERVPQVRLVAETAVVVAQHHAEMDVHRNRRIAPRIDALIPDQRALRDRLF